MIHWCGRNGKPSTLPEITEHNAETKAEILWTPRKQKPNIYEYIRGLNRELDCRGQGGAQIRL